MLVFSVLVNNTLLPTKPPTWVKYISQGVPTLCLIDFLLKSLFQYIHSSSLFFLPLTKTYFTYFEESHCCSLGNLSVHVFLLRWWLYFAHYLINCVSNIYAEKRKRKREKSLLLHARSFKYLDLSKNIKETRVHAISKDGPLLSCFFLHKFPQCSLLKTYLSAVSDIMSAHFRWINA